VPSDFISEPKVIYGKNINNQVSFYEKNELNSDQNNFHSKKHFQ
jgi:hypothetical protein